MRKTLVVLALFLSATAFSYVKVNYYQGMNFYSDGTGYYLGAGLRTDLKTILPFLPSWIFLGASYINQGAQSLDTLTGCHNAFLEAGLSIPLGQSHMLTLDLLAGMGWMKLDTALSNIVCSGISALPMVSLETWLGKNAVIGLDAGYFIHINPGYNIYAFTAGFHASVLLPFVSRELTE